MYLSQGVMVAMLAKAGPRPTAGFCSSLVGCALLMNIFCLVCPKYAFLALVRGGGVPEMKGLLLA
jgi:hypothetical protein